MPGMKTLIKSTEDFFAFGQANVEAFVKSGQIWADGVQELTKLFATTTKASFDASVVTFNQLGGFFREGVEAFGATRKPSFRGR
jgi:hypothetical protein